MNKFKKVLIVALLAVILGAGAGGVYWHHQHYLWIDARRYSRNAQQLDLREEKLSIRQYEKFRSLLPDCDILWKVPFQGGYYAEETDSLTITSLKETDIAALAYLPQLRTIDASGCMEYALLEQLQETYPQLTVEYSIVLGENRYEPDTEQLEISAIAAEEIDDLQYLRNLKTIVISSGENTENYAQLREYCREKNYAFYVRLGDMLAEESAQSLTVSGLQEGAESLLQFLPGLTRLHVLNPQISMEGLETIRRNHPNLRLSWNQVVCGKVFNGTDTEIDISGIPVQDLDVLAEQMTYFPAAEKLIMSDCGVDNEAMAQFREEHREDYKVVWTVQLGEKLKARTDDTTFMPTRERVYYFQDHESGNLKYCEDMICIDVGHMAIHDISFVEYMPNLQYLVLAHTEVRDITPLQNCKNLKFLELDWSTVRDFTPLLGCTALEDLNIGKTYPDLEPIAQMTWLKNLWMVGRSGGAYKVTQALTETKIVLSGSATVAGGWRDLPNYYAMRDLLGMHYMTW